MERTILHINVVNYYVSIACALEPVLRGFPLAIRAAGSKKALIDISSEAADAGVVRGMTPEAAKRKCPDLRVLDPVPSAYKKAEDLLIDTASKLSPQAETAGPGHLFIDLTGTLRLLGPAVDVADRVRKKLRNDNNIDCTVGLAQNRLVSKIATRVIKPSGLCSVISGCEEEFMAPLPLELLPGLDQRILEQLLQFNLHLIRDLGAIGAVSLASAIGPVAFDINRQAKGIDDTPVRLLEQPAPTVCEEITLGEQTNDEYEIAGALFHIVSKCGAKIRKLGLSTCKIRLRITYADAMQVSKSVTLTSPIRGDLSLYEGCSNLLKKLFTRRVRLSELSLEFSELTFPYGQLDLFSNSEREESLMDAIDTIRKSFGQKSIKFWGRDRVA
jgi:DNA polymerase-4